MELKKLESSMNTVTSTHQTESSVVDKPISKVWEELKLFNFEKLFPTNVKSLKFTGGNCNDARGVFDLTYSDGSVWSYGILEVSDQKRKISFELIEATPEVSFTSVQHTIKLIKVTAENNTFIEWSSDYTNDVNSHIIQDSKYKKLECFADMKKYFS